MFLADQGSKGYAVDGYGSIIVFASAADARNFGTPVPAVKYLKPRVKRMHLNEAGMTVCNRYSAWRTNEPGKVNCKDCLAEMERRRKEGAV